MRELCDSLPFLDLSGQAALKIVGRNKLEAFCDRLADARKSVEAWLAEVESAAWTSPQQIKDRYASVSFLPRRRVIFNIKGNRYRLVTTAAFGAAVIVIDWAGTHADYDTIDWDHE